MERDLTLNFDIEGNGLLQDITKVWCIVAQAEETEEMFVFHNFPQFDYARVQDPSDNVEYIIPKRNGTLEEGAKFLMNRGKKLVCHNIFGYDYFVLRKFFKFFKYPLRDCIDTLILSKMQWYDRPTPKGARGPHGLQAWGIRNNIFKPEVTDWSTMDVLKLHRCIEDVKNQTATTKALRSEREKLEQLVGVSLDEAIAIEHRYRYEATLQEIQGAPVDVPHMKACLEELDKFCAELRDIIEPSLPMTMKIKGVKAAAHDVATMLGAKNIPPRRYEKDGDDIVEVKSMYRPVTSWKTVEEVTRYAAVNEYLGIDTGYIFDKLKDAREYATEHFSENEYLYEVNFKNGKDLKKPKIDGWKYPKSTIETEIYNNRTCVYFDLEPTDYLDKGKLVDGPYTKVEFKVSTMSQHGVVKDFLLSLGWKPTTWNFKKNPDGSFARDPKTRKLIETTPKLTEDSFGSLPEGIGKQIADYNTYSHRRKFIENPADGEKGILNQVREDGRIPCGINSFSTSTGRSSHSVWVNAAGVGALYGENIRKIIKAPEGRVLVGADMKSAQLSIAAYYANNYDYYMAVADGQEVDENDNYIGMSGHCVNARAFGLVSEEEWKRAVETQDKELLHSIMLRRKLSKGGTFATIFGASGKKIATTIGIPERDGEEAKQRFLGAIGLDEPIARLQKMMYKYKRGKGGYLEIPFGYWVYCSQEHKVFNYIDQASEAVCQKVATNYFKDWLVKEVKAGNIDAAKILDYHDEFLCESHKDCAEEVGKAMCRAYKFASDLCFEWHTTKSQWFRDLTFPFNLDGGYKVGETYLSTH